MQPREQRMRDRETDNGLRALRADGGSATDRERGQVVMGPEFYVWDEVHSQARAWGIELADAWLARRR